MHSTADRPILRSETDENLQF